MKPRAKRVTIAAAVLGAGVVVVFVALNWGTVRDQVEPWRFQVSNKTETIEPDPILAGIPADLEADIYSPDLFVGSVRNGIAINGCVYSSSSLFRVLANCSGYPVIFASEEADDTRITFSSRFRKVTTEIARAILETNGWRIIEQYFPRRAYLVIRDKRTGVEQSPAPFPSPGILLPPRLLDEPKQSDPTQELLHEEEY
jgi:hypothetical protein